MMSPPGLRWFCALIGLALVGGGRAQAEPSKLRPEVGWNYGEQETARSAAMAGATRAIGTDVNGLLANPANMAASRVYHLAALAQIWPEANRQSYGAAAVDSSTSRIAAGLGGFYTIQDSDGLRRKALDLRLGLALPLSDRVFVGASGKYLKLQQNGLGPLGQSYASGGLAGDNIVDSVTFDAGLTVRPASLLWLSVLGTNLTNPGDGLRPLGLSGGVGVGKSEFSIEGDVAADFTTFERTRLRYMIAGEMLVAANYPVRLGYRYDDGLKHHAVSGGLGYLDRQFGVEVSVRRVVSGDSATTVVLGLQLFLEGLGLARDNGDMDMPPGQ